MELSNSNKMRDLAEKVCREDGVRLTKNRWNILTLMLSGKKALSAYEISDQLKDKLNISQPVMSVYRNLDFLEKRRLVHKISIVNKYTACSHIACKHKHDFIRIAVCSNCSAVKELLSEKDFKKDLNKNLDEIDFHLESKHLELIGLCSNCNKNK